MNREENISAIESMTVLELAELVKALEEKFGVSAAAPVAVAAGPAAAEAAPVEEKTEFDVIPEGSRLREDQGHQGSPRRQPSLGLKEAKEVVDNAPKTLKEGVNKEEARRSKKHFADVGATIEIK
jgi:large subunit ribosomal protein L7/L12